MSEATEADSDDAVRLPPVSEDDPCGPDLDIAGDADFLNYLADMEGRLPTAYFSFDPKTFDFDKAFADGLALLDRSQDVRLLVLMAKLAILRRDLDGFVLWLRRLAFLLSERWDSVNPKGEDDGDGGRDFLGRMAPLYTLDDTPVVILPLQHAPLVMTPREGPVTYRSVLVATGEVNAREKEKGPDNATIEATLLNCEFDDLAAVHAKFASLKTALADIRNASTANAGFDQAVRLEALPRLVDRILAYLQAAVVRRNPDAAVAEEAAGEDTRQAPASTGTSGRQEVRTRADADAMLSAALDYFLRNEPSSPAVLLIEQSRALLGKNIFEVMQLMVPSHADSARVAIGINPAFTVSVNAVASTSLEDDLTIEPPTAPDRASALALLGVVAAHCRTTEPSSPIPLLLDRARTLSARDFLGLLKEMFPEEVLATMKIGGD